MAVFVHKPNPLVLDASLTNPMVRRCFDVGKECDRECGPTDPAKTQMTSE